MSTTIESFSIESPQHGTAFKLDLAEGLDTTQLNFISSRWGADLQRQRDLAMLRFFQLPATDQDSERWHEILGEFDVQDHHWDWRTKCPAPSDEQSRIFSLLNAGDVEAVMLVRLDKRSRSLGEAGPIVYVDYLAVAPWNRKKIQDPQRFRHLGTVLLGAAVELSRALGCDGRCGLHALPQSEGYYRHIGMRDFGLDEDYLSLRYFEFDTVGATNFRR